MADTPLIYANFAVAPPTVPADGSSFTFASPPKSDIYVSPRSPKALYDYTAPVICRRIPKSSFVSLQVTAAAQWRTQFDQAGLVFTIPTKNNPSPDASNAGAVGTHPAWVKAGIEVNDGSPCVSIVARSLGGWSDWSLIPLFGSTLDTVVPVTLQFTREKNALMVWLIRSEAGKEQRSFIRKVPWVFLDDESGTLGDEALIGVYTAQPDPYDASEGKSLEVTFSGLSFETTGELGEPA